MKNIVYILILLFSSSILAQDPQLFDDTWYLQKLTIDGVESVPPQLEDVVEETTFDEMDELFSTGFCDFYNAEIDFNNSIDYFEINSIVYLGGYPCLINESYEFDVKYRAYFVDEQTYQNPFEYEITNDNGIRYLEFTNVNGDNALYANQLLAINEQNAISATLYPNPASSKINIRFNDFYNDAMLRIVDITGKEVYQSTTLTMDNEIEINTLKAGIYFLNITTEQGKKAVFKFIKE